MSVRPLLLLDVDGVLNPFARQPGFRTYECVVDGSLYRVRLSSRHGPALLALAAATGADLVWATTWEDEANQWIGPRIGLPPLPVVPLAGPRRVTGTGEMFKTPHVAEYAGGRPFVWLDDDVRDADEKYLRDHPDVGDFLLVHVEAASGLADSHLDQARDWLTGRH